MIVNGFIPLFPATLTGAMNVTDVFVILPNVAIAVSLPGLPNLHEALVIVVASVPAGNVTVTALPAVITPLALGGALVLQVNV
jgi:hypothetical protein